MRKVHYQEELPYIDLYTLMPFNYLYLQNDEKHLTEVQTAIESFLSTKASWWENEQEYRLIVREDLNSTIVSSSPTKVRVNNLIHSVYVGCSNRNKNIIDSIIQIANKKNFQVYQVKKRVDKYGLESELINP